MPLSWSEGNLKNHPRAFTIKDAAKRMARKKSDPFAGVLGGAPDLIAALKKLAGHPALKETS